jgi:hypothetical protein
VHFARVPGFQPRLALFLCDEWLTLDMYRVFHFDGSISAPRLDLGSKSQQILTLAQIMSIWDFQPLGAKTRARPVNFLTH